MFQVSLSSPPEQRGGKYEYESVFAVRNFGISEFWNSSFDTSLPISHLFRGGSFPLEVVRVHFHLRHDSHTHAIRVGVAGLMGMMPKKIRTENSGVLRISFGRIFDCNGWAFCEFQGWLRDLTLSFNSCGSDTCTATAVRASGRLLLPPDKKKTDPPSKKKKRKKKKKYVSNQQNPPILRLWRKVWSMESVTD